MKKLLIKFIFFILVLSLSGCSVNWVANRPNYSSNMHTHNEYCGHSGYHNGKRRKNTNLHYYDQYDNRRHNYRRGRNNKPQPKWVRKVNLKIHNKIYGHNHKLGKKGKNKNKHHHHKH